MIDLPVLIAWRSRAPWPDPVQVEQDLLLSRLMIEIANDEVLGPELVMRGGTCFHKLHLPTPLRYSEDLDYVRRTRSGIKHITSALGRIAKKLELNVGRRELAGQMARIYFDAVPAEGIGRIRIKVEINIVETESHQETTTINHSIDTSWWSGESAIPTFNMSELMATKFRALYQRRKGRDLFDLWLGLNHPDVESDAVISGFNHYMGDGAFSFPELRDNLIAKLGSSEFRSDVPSLVSDVPADYHPDRAAEVVLRELGLRLRNAPSLEEFQLSSLESNMTVTGLT